MLDRLALMDSLPEVVVVVAHTERATLRVGDTFLKVDPDGVRRVAEVEAMAAAPVPTPKVLWHQPPVLALAAVGGMALGTYGTPSSASDAAWQAAGTAVRLLHDAPLPPRVSRAPAAAVAALDRECTALVEEGLLPADLVRRNRALAEAALRPRPPAFVHGDLQPDHVFVDRDVVVGMIDWSEGGRGDPVADLAVLTLGHPERLDAVLAGYGRRVEKDAIVGWWSLRCLTAVRWLAAHGFDPTTPGAEIDVLRRNADHWREAR